jgi:hypothetical protein
VFHFLKSSATVVNCLNAVFDGITSGKFCRHYKDFFFRAMRASSSSPSGELLLYQPIKSLRHARRGIGNGFHRAVAQDTG